MAVAVCLRLQMHLARRAFSFPVARTGSSREARMPMIAMTTSSSISLKPSVLILPLGVIPTGLFHCYAERGVANACFNRRNLRHGLSHEASVNHRPSTPDDCVGETIRERQGARVPNANCPVVRRFNPEPVL